MRSRSVALARTGGKAGWRLMLSFVAWMCGGAASVPWQAPASMTSDSIRGLALFGMPLVGLVFAGNSVT